MSTARSLLPAFGAGFLFTLGGSGEKIAFAPDAGSTVQKSFKLGGEFELDSLSFSVDGNDMSSAMPANLEVSVKSDTHVDTSDVYKAVADGRPKDLLRTFESLGSSVQVHVSPAGTEMPDMSMVSALEGKTVAFHWNADKGEYERSFFKGGDKDKEKDKDKGSDDASMLEHLQEDMDLRAFLPSAEVSANDTWKVELKNLLPVAMPGGDLAMTPEGKVDLDKNGMEMFKDIFADFGKQVEDMLEGECTCTYKGARDEGGAHVAEIAIEVKLSTTLDLSDMLEKAIHAALEQQGVGGQVDFSLDTADLNVEFDGTGTLLWNLKAGRAQSFQLNGDVSIGMNFSINVDAENQNHSAEASLEMKGSMHNELETKE